MLLMGFSDKDLKCPLDIMLEVFEDIICAIYKGALMKMVLY